MPLLRPEVHTSMYKVDLHSLGWHGSLGLAVSSFDPRYIKCAGLGRPDDQDCEVVLDSMPYSSEDRVFGVGNDPKIQVPLPDVYKIRNVSFRERWIRN